MLSNVSYKANDSATYVIYGAKPVFFYRDSKQQAKIVGNDTIIIKGGFLEVDISFNWIVLGQFPINGTGFARGLSD